ncbi:hypothetical protein LJC20_03385 [Eubacteriales bacterium OttesenSCG-928-M02]|nr:hypothetical protein [Eubacteriales bacterium OttesenSCG-928-M02]
MLLMGTLLCPLLGCTTSQTHLSPSDDFYRAVAALVRGDTVEESAYFSPDGLSLAEITAACGLPEHTALRTTYLSYISWEVVDEWEEGDTATLMVLVTTVKWEWARERMATILPEKPPQGDALSPYLLEITAAFADGPLVTTEVAVSLSLEDDGWQVVAEESLCRALTGESME